MRAKHVLYLSLLIFSIFFINNCVAGFLGVPDAFRGYYQSAEPVLDGDNYFYFRVNTGTLTMYFGTNGQTNLMRNEYDAITPYNIIGIDYTYTFETPNMSGTIIFNGNTSADVKLNKYSPLPEMSWSGVCNRVN